MSEQPFVPAPSPPGDDYTPLPADAAAAAQDVAAVSAASQEQITDRGPLLPAEISMDAVMAQLKAQSEMIAALQGQVGVMQKQAEQANAVAGGPPVSRYAQAVVDKLAALRAAHPDLPGGHLDQVQADAAAMLAAAHQLARGEAGADPGTVHELAARIDRFFTRTHWRQPGTKWIDFSAVAGDAEQVAEEAARLAA